MMVDRQPSGQSIIIVVAQLLLSVVTIYMLHVTSQA